jgi:preprotein translocase subunit SecD
VSQPGHSIDRRVTAAVAVLAMAVTAGCRSSSTPATFLIRFGSSDGTVVGRAADVINRRLKQGGVDAAAHVEGPKVRVVLHDSSSKNAVLALSTRPGRLEFRPVVAEMPPPCHTVTGAEGVGERQVPQMSGGVQHSCFDLAAVVLDGSSVARASASPPQAAEGWSVGLTFTPDGGVNFDHVASTMLTQRLAIVVDDRVLSAPRIQSAHFNGHAVITGAGSGFTKQDAESLAVVLGLPPLPAVVAGVECFGGACGSSG